MYGMDANFMRAQLAYDNAEPPDWDAEGTEHKGCEEEMDFPEDAPEDADQPFCTFAGDVDVYYAGWTAVWTCPECGAKHEDDCEPEAPERDRDDY
jgi:hypothetical protein